jgi:hypothetical protein
MNVMHARRLGAVSRLLVVVTVLTGSYRAYWHWTPIVAFAEPAAKSAPTTLQELDDYYPQVPPEENAALVFLQGCNAVRTSQYFELEDTLFGRTALPVPVQPFPAEMKDLMSKCLVDNGPGIALLHKAAAMPKSRYPVDMTQGVRMELPHLALLRGGTRMLCMQALYAAETHDSDTAVWALKDAVALADSVREEPIIIAQLVRAACAGIDVRTLEQALNRNVFSESQLAALQEAFARLDGMEPFARAFEGERCSLGLALATGAPGGGPPPPSPQQHADFVAKTTQLIEACRRPFPAPLDVAMPMAKAGATPGEYADPRGPAPLTRGVIAAARFLAGTRLAETALAVERYRDDNKKLPEKIADLVPAYLKELLLDPFDGAPLRYRPVTNGYIVYSVADNRQDDKGEGSDEHPPKDIVFAVQRAQ